MYVIWQPVITKFVVTYCETFESLFKNLSEIIQSSIFSISFGIELFDQSVSEIYKILNKIHKLVTVSKVLADGSKIHKLGKDLKNE